jgi:hypothetical protein
MADVSIGPGGYEVNSASCANNTFLADQNNPLGSLKDTLHIQRVMGLQKMLYPPQAEEVDRHMPMRASSASRVDGVVDYNIGVGYDGLLNATTLTDVTPSSSPYTDTQKLLTACQDLRTKGLSAKVNGNAEACNPVIDGPVPKLGTEAFGRRGYVLRLPIPPICFASFTNKEAFHRGLGAVLDAVQNGTLTAWAAGRKRWMIEHSRYNIAPVQVNQGDGSAKLPVSADLITPFTFGRVPEHYGSFEWVAAMLRLTEIPRAKNVTVELPAAVFERYKTDAGAQLGINIFEQAANLSQAVNGYNRTILEDSIIYTDRSTGRKIKFMASMNPWYVEIQETGPNRGDWQFQEYWIFRDSETADNIMPRENPNFGVACSCPDKILGAIITISVDGEDKPFAMEPFPVNPDSGLRALINQYNPIGGTVNTTLREMYPTMLETRIFTGLEAQTWMLDPLNRRYREAGVNCDVASNIENTWIAGYCKISGVFVETNPRKVVNLLVRVPQVSHCVDLFAPCEDTAAITAGGAVDPLINEIPKQVLPVPEPEPEPAEAAGTIFVMSSGKNITAPCEGDGAENKEVSIKLVRRGGSAGELTITVAASETAHSGTVPASVVFADGELVKYLTWEILPWSCPEGAATAPERFDIEFSGAGLDPDTYESVPVCIKCNSVCPDDCGLGSAGCLTC